MGSALNGKKLLLNKLETTTNERPNLLKIYPSSPDPARFPSVVCPVPGPKDIPVLQSTEIQYCRLCDRKGWLHINLATSGKIVSLSTRAARTGFSKIII